jgi:VanZ family protein
MSILESYRRSLRHVVPYTAGAAAFGAFLLYICTLPHSVIERRHYPDISTLFDAMNHFIGFMIFNFLLASAGKAIGVRRAAGAERAPGDPNLSAGFNKTTILMLAIGLLWGLVCETAQLLVPSRSFQIIDIAANCLPALIIGVIIYYTQKRSETASSPQAP